MAKKQTRRSISLSAAMYAAVGDRARAQGKPLSRYVHDLLIADLGDVAPAYVGLSTNELVWSSEIRRWVQPPTQKAIAANPPPPKRPVDVVSADANALLARARPGKPVPEKTHGVCAICAADVYDVPVLEPLGKGNAMVRVCEACRTEEPVEGTHSFGAARGGSRSSARGRRVA